MRLRGPSSGFRRFGAEGVLSHTPKINPIACPQPDVHGWAAPVGITGGLQTRRGKSLEAYCNRVLGFGVWDLP